MLQSFGIKKLVFEVNGHEGYISVLDQLHEKPKLVARGRMAMWSPDGRKIAYCTPEPFAVMLKGTMQFVLGQMQLVSADGAGRKQLTDIPGGACPIDWSPDGKTIAFAAGSGEHGFVVLAPGENGVGNVVSGNAGRWSPDGSKMLFWKQFKNPKSSGSIWVADGDGLNPRKLIDDSSIDCPSWNPDSQRILFSSDREHKGKYEVFQVKLDGSGLETFASDNKYSLYCPLLSPDGKYLVVDVHKHDSDDSTIMVLDMTNHAETPIAHGRNPRIIWESR
jgi:Tol biopolymer transport system component